MAFLTMTKINNTAAYTICSLNYLAQAMALANSLYLHCQNWKFFVCIVDAAADNRLLKFPENTTIINVSDLSNTDINSMYDRYNIIELCTATKPFFAKYIFEKYLEIDFLHYIDPDIFVYHNLEILNEPLLKYSASVTPHHLSPIPLDGEFPQENLALNHGIYNLGYLGLKRSAETTKLLDWWRTRMILNCKIDLANGYFVDQIYFNYINIYFNDIHIQNHPGCNVAFWNFHERTVISSKHVLFEKEMWPLLFFHFSGFSIDNPSCITRIKTRKDTQQNLQINKLAHDYSKLVKSLNYSYWRNIAPHYGRSKIETISTKTKLKRQIGSVVRKIAKYI